MPLGTMEGYFYQPTTLSKLSENTSEITCKAG
jgi:hypothetical protein